MDKFDAISPADYRYLDPEVAECLSENGFTRYKLGVESSLAKTLADFGICPAEAAFEIAQACSKITTEEVYAEEDRVRHDIRALVNCIQAKVSDEAKPYVHMTATSFDIVDTANAARYKDVTYDVVVPALKKLLRILVDITRQESATVQVGRTHGQHAVPITFGFYMAGITERLGQSIKRIDERASELVGKFSGAVGAYNASQLVVDNPMEFEGRLLSYVGLRPATHSTQIAPPEPMLRLLTEMVVAAGVMANLARDMRNLQRTEIAEVGEEFGAEQVGSSTMPQKRNPINFENIESMWKVLVGRLGTLYLDQISEHQRDLTGSASGRTNAEIVNYVVVMAKRLTRTMDKLRVDQTNLDRNLASSEGAILAEPLYILLAKYGHPDAHEAVRVVTQAWREARRTGNPRSLQRFIQEDLEIAGYVERFTADEVALIENANPYIGLAYERAQEIAAKWQRYLDGNAGSASSGSALNPDTSSSSVSF